MSCSLLLPTASTDCATSQWQAPSVLHSAEALDGWVFTCSSMLALLADALASLACCCKIAEVQILGAMEQAAGAGGAPAAPLLLLLLSADALVSMACCCKIAEVQRWRAMEQAAGGLQGARAIMLMY